MRIQVSPEYHWLFGMLLIVPSGSVFINGRWWDAAKFVWWWPVNWVMYPIVRSVRYFNSKKEG